MSKNEFRSSSLSTSIQKNISSPHGRIFTHINLIESTQASNIDSKKELDDLETKAWISKLEQVYEKANLVMGDTPHFSEINDIYTHKKRQLKIRKFKSRLFIYFLFGIYFIFIYAMLLQEYPIVMISITIVGFVVTILGFKLYNKYLKE